MNFGEILGGAAQGVQQGIGITNSLNDMWAKQDATKLREMEMKRLDTEVDLDNTPGFQYFDDDIKAKVKAKVAKFDPQGRITVGGLKRYTTSEAEGQAFMQGLTQNHVAMQQEAIAQKLAQAADFDKRGMVAEADAIRKVIPGMISKAQTAAQTIEKIRFQSMVNEMRKSATPEQLRVLDAAAATGDEAHYKNVMLKIVEAQSKEPQYASDFRKNGQQLVNGRLVDIPGWHPKESAQKAPTAKDVAAVYKMAQEAGDAPSPTQAALIDRAARTVGLQYKPVQKAYNREFLGVKIPGTRSIDTKYELGEGAAQQQATGAGGPTVNPTQVHPVLQQLFGADAGTMAKIMNAESGGQNIRSRNANSDGTYDWGLFQINDIHKNLLIQKGIIKNDMSELLDPNKNLQAARLLYQASGLKPWASSKSRWGAA